MVEMSLVGFTWKANLQGVVNVFHAQMVDQQQENWEGILGQVRGIWKLCHPE